MPFDARSLLRLTRTAVRLLRAPKRVSGTGSRQPGNRQSGTGTRQSNYPGDFTGTPRVSYAPRADGEPDAGEIVWAWVPYEEDHRQGKDRPVLLIGTHRGWLLGLMLTSRDRNRPGSDDPAYIDIGSGPWDAKGRPSEVRTDRIIRLTPAAVRRIGAVLPRAQFEQVTAQLG